MEVLQCLSNYRTSLLVRKEALWAELVEVCCAMREAIDSFATGLSHSLTQLSAMPTFPGDLDALARRCIGSTMAYLQAIHEEDESHFKVLKEKRGDLIYQFHVKNLGTRGIHLPLAED